MVRRRFLLLPLVLSSPALAAAPADGDRPVTSVAADPYVPRMLSRADARADVALARRALETVHPGLYRYQSRAAMDRVFARLERAVDRPISDLALWREFALLAAQIHCDHTKPEPPDRVTAYRESHATHLPFRFAVVEGRMIVVSADGQPGAPPVGAEITALGGTPVPRIVNTLAHAVAYDGATENAIAAKLADDGDLMGDDLDEYWPAFYGFAPTWTVDWKQVGARDTQQAVLAPIGFAQWRALAGDGRTWRDEFYRSVRWNVNARSAYLRIDTFVNYRNPVDATAFLGGFFGALKKSGAQQLTLDLRNNGGGSDDVAVALGRYLMPQAFVWSKPPVLKAVRYGDLPAHIESWGDRQALFEPPLEDFRRLPDGRWERIVTAQREDDEGALEQAPADDRYSGALTVLIGPRNASGATRTVAQLHEKRAARLVGEDTAGSAEGPTAGHIFLLTLPHSGVKLRIPNAWNRTNIAHFTPGLGVAADEVVVPTLLDQLGRTDRVLAVATETGSRRTPQPLSSALAGRWSGVLEYRDYRSDRRVVLPTELDVSGADDAAALAFAYDDGPGKLVTSTEAWQRSGETLTIDKEQFRIVEYRAGSRPGDFTLVAAGKGQENDVAVHVLVMATRRDAQLHLSRLTRRDGEPFLLRHSLVLTVQL